MTSFQDAPDEIVRMSNNLRFVLVVPPLQIKVSRKKKVSSCSTTPNKGKQKEEGGNKSINTINVQFKSTVQIQSMLSSCEVNIQLVRCTCCVGTCLKSIFIFKHRF